jgi:hypothetical protein
MAICTRIETYSCGHTKTWSVPGYREDFTQATTSDVACDACRYAPGAPDWMRYGYASPEGYEGLKRMTRDGYHPTPASIADVPSQPQAARCPRCSGPLSACGGFCGEEA